jgi:uncharacterized protein YigA (DUF484 family)
LADSGEERRLRDAVLGYLREHPEAMDTLEGIAEWWLMAHQVRTDVAMLERVLERLTQERILEQCGSGGVARFRLRQ